jgi:hypothetical protein
MHVRASRSQQTHGFSFAEVCMGMLVCALFAGAAFGTNQRLLMALRTQKETTAATMILQQRMEALRASSFTNVASTAYLTDSIFKLPTSTDADPSFWQLYQQLGNLTEQVAVGVYGDTSQVPIVLNRDSQHSYPQTLSDNGNLTNYPLLQVDLVLQWTGANGRTRTRTMSGIFGKGNIGP